MAQVALEKVGKTFPGGVVALRDVSLRIEDGELLALVGPSGSGKTTLLRLIAGLESPTTGIIRIGDRIVNDMPPYRRDVAMVFQRPALYPHLSVRDNLAFGLKRRRWWIGGDGKAAIHARVVETAQQLGLADVLERRPATLSGGQQQRVALGRALVRQPAVFLLDEPLSNLDARLRLEMRRELHLLHRRIRATIIHVTHDQDEAMSLGERVVVLDRGGVRQVDRPQVLYDRPSDRFVAGFLGWPPMNLLDGELASGACERPGEPEGLHPPLAFRNQDVCLVSTNRPDWRPLVGRPLTLGIRPEDIRLADGPGEGRLAMQVRFVERLGPVQLVTLAAAGWTGAARLAATPPIEEGAKVFAAFDLTRAHLFDPATGLALCHGRSEGMRDEG
jgi:multiple sugar transport system ATP-binding protein